jgi:hypothetical protein
MVATILLGGENHNRRHEEYIRTTFWDYGQSYTTSSYLAEIGDVVLDVVTRREWITETWAIWGRGYHRDGAPARLTRARPSGIITGEEWYQKGRLHRERGPAVTRRDKTTGQITYLGWYKNGKCVTARKFEQSCEPNAPKKEIASKRPRAAVKGPSGYGS